MIQAPVGATISPAEVCLSYILNSAQINTFINRVSVEITQ